MGGRCQEKRQTHRIVAPYVVQALEPYRSVHHRHRAGDNRTVAAIHRGPRQLGLAGMAGHVPFVTPVCKGQCRVQLTDQTEWIGHISEGLLNVSHDKTVLMTGELKWEHGEKEELLPKKMDSN